VGESAFPAPSKTRVTPTGKPLDQKKRGGVFWEFFDENLGNFSNFWGKKSPKS
jgi:hypothetical protein